MGELTKMERILQCKPAMALGGATFRVTLGRHSGGIPRQQHVNNILLPLHFIFENLKYFSEICLNNKSNKVTGCTGSISHWSVVYQLLHFWPSFLLTCLGRQKTVSVEHLPPVCEPGMNLLTLGFSQVQLWLWEPNLSSSAVQLTKSITHEKNKSNILLSITFLWMPSNFKYYIGNT